MWAQTKQENVSVTRAGNINSANAEPRADALDGPVLMYMRHAAMEDTVVFSARKIVASAKDCDELFDRFGELEHRMFGKDGFEDAVARIAAIEQTLGTANLAAFGAPMPPKPK